MNTRELIEKLVVYPMEARVIPYEGEVSGLALEVDTADHGIEHFFIDMGVSSRPDSRPEEKPHPKPRPIIEDAVALKNALALSIAAAECYTKTLSVAVDILDSAINEDVEDDGMVAS